MNIEIIQLQDLDEYVKKCEKALLIGEPEVFQYPENLIGKGIADSIWEENVEIIKKSNSDLLSSLRNNANIYAIYVQEPTKQWCLKYVGQRKSKDIRERITQHLITKNERTGSKLEYIREVVSKGYLVGLRFIKSDRDSLRTFVEEEIISRNKSKLPWNVHG